MIKLTIDGKPIEVPQGTTVLEAARANHINIPTLCDHPALEPYGGCRLCVVEVQGARLPQASCTLPAAEGMVIKTDTPALRAGRKFVLTMLFSERNHFCPFCQLSGGDCELQNAAYGEDMTHWDFQPNWKPFPVDASHPDFVLDNNRCILCRRCVRACTDLVGNATLGIEERGAASLLVADFGVPWGSSTCIACGTCAQICPTGAIIDRNSSYQGQDRHVTHTQSICVGCSVGCGIDLITRDNRLVRIDGDWAAALNGGVLCHAGRIEPLQDHRNRLTTPLLRRNGKLEPATWDEALSRVATRLQPLMGQAESGVAAVASTRLPAETLAAFQSLFSGKLGSNMVTSIEEGRPTALPAALADELKQPFETPLSALHTADCIVTVDVNLTKAHEVVGFFVKRRVRAGAKLVVVDGHENPLSALATATVLTPQGQDLAVLKTLTSLVKQYKLRLPPTPVSADPNLHVAAQLLAAAEHPAIVYGKGLLQAESLQLLAVLRDLSLACQASLVSVKGKANSAAASQLNLDQPFKLNGHKAVFVALGDDDAPGLPQKLEHAPFLVVQAAYTGPLTEQADVVLPVEMWAEQSGHYLSLDGQLQTAQAALQPPAGVRSNLSVLQALAQQLNVTLEADWQAQLAARTSIVAHNN